MDTELLSTNCSTQSGITVSGGTMTTNLEEFAVVFQTVATTIILCEDDHRVASGGHSLGVLTLFIMKSFEYSKKLPVHNNDPPDPPSTR